MSTDELWKATDDQLTPTKDPFAVQARFALRNLARKADKDEDGDLSGSEIKGFLRASTQVMEKMDRDRVNQENLKEKKKGGLDDDKEKDDNEDDDADDDDEEDKAKDDADDDDEENDGKEDASDDENDETTED